MFSYKFKDLKEVPFRVLTLISSIEFLLSIFVSIFLLKSINLQDVSNFFLLRTVTFGVLIILSVSFIVLLISRKKVISKIKELPTKYLIIVRVFVFTLGYWIIFSGIWILMATPEFWKSIVHQVLILKPLFITSSLVACQWMGYFWIKSHRLIIQKQKLISMIKQKTFWIVFSSLLGLFILLYVTKFGFVLKTTLWNVPGIPISSFQTYTILSCFLYYILIMRHLRSLFSVKVTRVIKILLPILIFLTSVFVWGLQPLNGDATSLLPASPNFQPYPLRDARVHDLGALSILYGEGIYFHNYTDKPLYMILLAIFHLISGDNYYLLTWCQIVFLGLIPVILFWLGRKLVSSSFGVLVASFLIIQQRNAIALSRNIASSNFKLFLTEGTTFLGLVLIAALITKWYQTRKLKYIFLTGGAIGAVSLIRLNPILLFPAVGLFVILLSLPSKRFAIRQILVFTTGFFLVFSPWLISGVNNEGKPWLYIKIKDVIQNRVAPAVDQTTKNIEDNSITIINSSNTMVFDTNPQETASISKLPSVFPEKTLVNQPEKILDTDTSIPYLKLFLNHYAHNIITSVLTLPDSLHFLDIFSLSSREYWDDYNNWHGDLKSSQIVLIGLNIFFISIGIAFSWSKRRWAGLIPLLLFLVYDVAISISLTSGGRYIVPINWIVIFYWVLGLYISFHSLIGNAVLGKVEEISQSLFNPQTKKQKSQIPYIFILLIPAILILTSNILLPALKKEAEPVNPLVILKTNGFTPDPTATYYSGKLFYPYIEENTFTFDFLRDGNIETFNVNAYFFHNTMTKIGMGDEAILEFKEVNQLQRVFLMENDHLRLYWGKFK